MIFSKFVHIFNVSNDSIALYHSLIIRVVFVSESEYDGILNFLHTGKCDESVSKENINYLFSNFFIVKDDKEDETLYSRCIDLISPPAISNAYIVVTENCNFNCKYCFISKIVQKDQASKVMSKEVASKAIEQLQKAYERQRTTYDKTITFYGGEPLLNLDVIVFFMEEIERIKQAGFYWPSDVKFALISNGTLIDEKVLAILQKYNIALSISFDFDPKAQSQRIAKNNIDSDNIVRKKIELCKKLNFPFSLSITISENTIKSKEFVLSEIYKISPATVAFNMLIPNEFEVKSDDYYKKATEFMIESFKSLRKWGIYEDRIMRKVNSFEKGQLFLYDCCASGGNQFVIDPSGDIGICHGYLNNHKFFTESVFDDNFDFRKSPTFRFWKKRSPLYMEQCQKCECLGICGGGCPYAADFMHNSIYAIDDRFCIHAKTVLQWLISDLYDNLSTGISQS